MTVGLLSLGRTPSVILDLDIVTDAGDIGALQVAIALAKTSETRLVAIVTNSSDTKSAPCVQTILNSNSLAVPVGAYMGSATPSVSTFTSQIVSRFGTSSDTRANYTDATTLLRSTLAAQNNGSVDYVSIGFGVNLAALFASAADGVSALNGVDLFAAKVRKLVIMGGEYPSGIDAYNFIQDKTSWSYIFANKPSSVPAYFWGGAQGTTVISGPAQNGGALVSPSYYGYTLEGTDQGGGLFTRPDWDQMAVLFAVRGFSSGGVPLFNIGGANGTVSFNGSTAATSWSSSAGPDNYLGKTALDATIASVITGLMAGVI